MPALRSIGNRVRGAEEEHARDGHDDGTAWPDPASRELGRRRSLDAFEGANGVRQRRDVDVRVARR